MSRKRDKATAKHYTNGQSQNITFPLLTTNESKPLPDWLETLKRHKHYHDFLVSTGELVNFSAQILNEVLTAYQNIDPYIHVNQRCPACIAEFLIKVYKDYDIYSSNSVNR